MPAVENGTHVLALGRYLGYVRESVAVQNTDGYSFAYRVQYQREREPSQGWFLARDVVKVYRQAIMDSIASIRTCDATVSPTSASLFEETVGACSE